MSYQTCHSKPTTCISHTPGSSQVSSRLSPALPVEKRLKLYAKALGTATSPQLALALLPVPRSNFLAWLLPAAEFSSLIKYHRFVCAWCV